MQTMFEPLWSYVRRLAPHWKKIAFGGAFLYLSVSTILGILTDIRDSGVLGGAVEVSLEGATEETQVFGITRNDVRYAFEREGVMFRHPEGRYLVRLRIQGGTGLRTVHLRAPRVELVWEGAAIEALRTQDDEWEIRGENDSRLGLFRSVLNYRGDEALFFLLLRHGVVYLVFLAVVFGVLKFWSRLKELLEKVLSFIAGLPFDINPYIIIVVTLANFLWNNPTAFDWPAIDMGPFFERLEDPNFAPNDFYTNTFQYPTARHVFGYFIYFFSRIFGVKWYVIFFAFKMILLSMVPCLWYLVLRKLTESKSILFNAGLAYSVLWLLNQENNYSVAFGWWPPYLNGVIPQNFSIILGLIACLYVFRYLESHKRTHFVLSMLFLFAGTLIQFTVGLFLFILIGMIFVISDAANFEKIKLIALSFVVSVLFPVVLLYLFFTDHGVSLPAEDFIKHYIHYHHSFHYLVSSLPDIHGRPWIINFALMWGLCLGSMVITIYLKNARGALFSFLVLITSLGAVLSQYFFIEIMPLKVVAIIGPVRFLTFFYFLTIASVVICFNTARNYLFNMKKVFRLFNEYQVKEIGFQKIFYPSVIILFIFGLLIGEDPVSKIKSRDPEFFDFMENTSSESVFLGAPASGYDLREILLVGRRSLFTSESFPFNERFFEEHTFRRNFAYGIMNHPYWGNYKNVQSSLNHFLNLSLEAYLEIQSKYPLDYVVVKLEDKNQVNLPPETLVFSGKNYAVFKVSNRF